MTAGFGFAASAQAATIYVAPPPIMTGTIGTSCTLPNYNSIQTAVNMAATGDTVVVCDGVYEEQVKITKSLTLAGSGDSIIDAPTALAANEADRRNVVEVRNEGVRVRMSGFIVRGPVESGACGSVDAGIAVINGATLDLGFATIRDIRQEPFSGCQNGEGIRVGTQGTFDLASHATIDNVIVTEYQKNGITVNGTGSSAKIMNTTVRGIGATTITAQNGIQVSRGAAATITTSTIRDNIYPPTTFFACGLLIFDAAGVNDDENIFLNNEEDKCTFNGRGGTYEGMP